MSMTKRQRERREMGANVKKYQAMIGGAPFSMLRHDLIFSEEFRALSGNAVKVLAVLMGMFKSKPNNNGDLSAPLTNSYELFGMSDKTLQRAISELLEAEFLEISRSGNKYRRTLYALTFYPIGDFSKQGEPSHIDLPPSKRPSDKWKKSKANKV